MLVKVALYGFIILWGALIIFAYKNIKKSLNKYRSIKDVEDICNWKGTKRTDFNKWDEKSILYGCIVTFPFKFMVILFDLIAFALTVLSRDILRKINKNLDKIIMKYIGFSTLKLVYEIIQQQPLSSLQTPIVISNHVNWFDIAYHCIRFFPISFVSKAEMKKVPVLGRVATKIQCVYLQRDSEAARALTLEKIQNQIKCYNQDNDKFHPMIIFPEGTTSNGRSILRFKIGAFQKKAKITIVSFNYSCKGFDMGMDEITPIEHFIISLCLKPKLDVKFKVVESNNSESPEQYMLRCQQELSRMTGFPIQPSGFSEKIKLKQARFGKKQA